jgi:hypothetical protein
MFGHKAALSALFVSATLALGLTAGVSRAEDIASSEGQFCRAIGLDETQRPACMDQMAAASTTDERDQVAAAWIMRSPLAANSPNSLYQPPTDQNKLNGTPGTPYQDKINVSNEVNAQIHRGLKINHLE